MASQAKKDAAAQAYTLGLQAFKRKDLDRAAKYLKKSILYNPTREAQHLLNKIENLKPNQQRQRPAAPQYKLPKTQKATSDVRIQRSDE